MTNFTFTNRYLQSFARRYSETALTLASYAAFPHALTPELLYLIRENFVPEVDFVDVTYVLLSLCDPVGFRLYKMPGDIRYELLEYLKTKQGEQKLKDLADFMIDYISAKLPQYPYASEDLGAAPEWTALSFINPNAVNEKMAEKLKAVLEKKNVDDILYCAHLYESYEPFANLLGNEFNSLLTLVRGSELQRYDYMEAAKEEFDKLGKPGGVLQIAGFGFTIPVVMDLHIFEFQTVTVNRKGKIIHTETKSARYLTEDLGDGIILDMVEIPGGTLRMGAPDDEEGAYDSEKPQHEVTLGPFFMAKYAITQAQWRAVAQMPRVTRDLDPNPSRFQCDQRPVERVSWLDAVEFCARLSKYTRKDYGLPSESHWEYACRSRTQTPFYLGETITADLVNYDGNHPYGDALKGEYRKQTTDVGIFPPNGFGLYDMHGNVWEWCADERHRNYEGAPTDGSAWIDDDNHSQRDQPGNNLVDEKINKNDNKKIDEKINKKRRLLRGGSWCDNAVTCRSAYRNDLSPEVRDNRIGFRVVVRQ